VVDELATVHWFKTLLFQAKSARAPQRLNDARVGKFEADVTAAPAKSKRR
jgi:hypothetical protein